MTGKGGRVSHDHVAADQSCSSAPPYAYSSYVLMGLGGGMTRDVLINLRINPAGAAPAWKYLKTGPSPLPRR